MTVNRRPFSHLNPTDGLTPVALSRSASTALAYFHPSTSVLITPQAARPSARATKAANLNAASLVMSATLRVGTRSIARRVGLCRLRPCKGASEMLSQAAKPPGPAPSPRLRGERANMQSEAKRSNVAIEKRRTPAARERRPVTGRVTMRKFAAAILAGAALSVCVAGLAHAKAR